jgi:hypothetical protein
MVMRQKQIIDFVQSFWMPISAFFGFPLVALASKYRGADVDFTFLHAVDVANLSFSLWGSFAVSYFTVYCIHFVWMRVISVCIDFLIDRRASKFLRNCRLADPRSISRYRNKVDAIMLSYREAFRRSETPYFRHTFWAVLVLWFAIWKLPPIQFFLAGIVSYLLFSFENWTVELRNAQYQKSSRYRPAGHISGSRQERIARYQKELEERERRPKIPWYRRIPRMIEELPSVFRIKVNWNATEAKIISAVCLLTVALNFGSGAAKAAKDGPSRIFRLGNQELCGKLLVQSVYGYHISRGAEERLFFLPQVSAIEDLPANADCEDENTFPENL